eukprot:4583250-Amphidinium_carterae.1
MDGRLGRLTPTYVSRDVGGKVVPTPSVSVLSHTHSVSLTWMSVRASKTWMNVGYLLSIDASSLPDGAASVMDGDPCTLHR